MHADFSQIGPFLLAAVVVFGVYRRFRRHFGRQLLRPARMIARIVLLAVVGFCLLPMALRSAQFLSAEAVGAALGVGMAFLGAERTRFQMYEGRLHYVPHTYTGIAVSLLFLGRLVFRFVQVYAGYHATVDHLQAAAGRDGAKSPDFGDILRVGGLLRVLLQLGAVEIQAPQDRRHRRRFSCRAPELKGSRAGAWP